MKAPVKRGFLTQLNYPVDLFLEEYPFGAGRTDIVFAKVSYKRLQHRINNLGLDEDFRSYLSEFLILKQKGPISRDRYLALGANKTKTRKKRRRALEWLVSSGFIHESNGKLHPAPNFRRHLSTIIAVELKLTKWRQALIQARRGKTYSHYQFVVLDASKISGDSKLIGEFEDHNVGLVGLTQTGELDMHVEPERQTPTSTKSLWDLNEDTFQLFTSKQKSISDFHDGH